MLGKLQDSNSLADRRSSPFPSHQARRRRGLVTITVADQVIVQTLPVEVVCRRYQPEAERLLYQNIKFAQYDEHTRACLKILTNVPRKALLAKTFWIYWKEPLQGATLKAATFQLLGEALLAMTSLKLLHLRLYHNRYEPSRSVMNSFLRRCTFSLDTLFLPDYLDLEKWIPQQRDLTSIGLYITRRQQADAEQLSVYRALSENVNPERSINIWSITQEGTHMDTVHAYPAFSRRWTAEPIAKSMTHVLPSDWIRILDLHVMNLSDHDVVGPIISSVARYLPGVSQLRFVVRNRDIHLNPAAFASSLSQLPELTYVEVDYHDGDSTGPYQKKITELGQTWSAGCPKVTYIKFPDNSLWSPPTP